MSRPGNGQTGILFVFWIKDNARRAGDAGKRILRSAQNDKEGPMWASAPTGDGRLEMSVQDNIRTSLLSGGFAAGPKKNTPTQYADRQTQYFGEVTELFNAEYAQYASDYMSGELSYFDENGNEIQKAVTFRFANVVRPTAAIQRFFDDYKAVLFDQLELDYVQPGAKLTCNGSVWLAYNPDNVSSVTPNSIFRRCNAVWNHLDFYGNVVSEPIVKEPELANASTPDAQNSQMVARGYYNVICQYNDFTRQVNDNTRLILGSKSYIVTGYGDYSAEFTGDYSTLRILKFTIRTETKNRDTDDMENHVAEGKTFSWEPYIAGPEKLSVAQGDFAYQVISNRNGEAVENTLAHPIYYTYEIDDPETAEISPIGNNFVYVKPLQEGTVTLTATLAQNPNIKATLTVSVTANHKAVNFLNAGPKFPLEPYQSIPLRAYAFDENGILQTGVPITYTWGGAAEGSYRVNVTGHLIEVTCYGYSETPLIITATGGPGYENLSDTTSVYLEGY